MRTLPQTLQVVKNLTPDQKFKNFFLWPVLPFLKNHKPLPNTFLLQFMLIPLQNTC